MTEHSQTYEILFAQASDEALLTMAAAIVNGYAEQGLMLAVSLEQLQQIAAQGMLALSVTPDQQTIGVAGITFQHPDGKLEFGGWAVQPDWIHTGVGKQLLHTILEKAQGSPVIAFGNHNSGPIFQKLGATVMDQQTLHPSAFDPCETCLCPAKHHLTNGQKCVDTIFDLTTIQTTKGSKHA